jgi:hypothetical protein
MESYIVCNNSGEVEALSSNVASSSGSLSGESRLRSEGSITAESGDAEGEVGGRGMKALSRGDRTREKGVPKGEEIRSKIEFNEVRGGDLRNGCGAIHVSA